MKRAKQKGITLIALVITIVVLLILAAVSIATLTGQNGILNQADKAKENTAKETAREKVAVEVLGSYGRDGNLDHKLLEDNLNNIKGIEGVLSPITELPLTVIVDGYPVTIKDNGDVTVGEKNDNPPITTGKTDGSFDEKEGVNTPKLGNNMELVIYDEGTKEWIPDETKKAYKYEAQTGTTENRGTSEWANAKVTINGVESYFVWIPRYAYKIDSTNQVIDVKFIKDTGEEATDGTICKYANDSTLDTNTDYIIHPAFTTNADLGGGWENELPGLWIGKYEVSQSDAGTTKDEMGSSGIIQIKPNVTSWRNITIGEMYEKAKAYSPELKSHMLKNSEWGAVAYLTHSKYGRNETGIATNNNSNFLTGNAGDSIYAGESTTTNAYDTEKGVLASSTGNVYGIYDLSGGAYEYVASYYSGSSNLSNGNQLVKETNREYVTTYAGTDVDTDYKQGDATKETKEWDGNHAAFISSSRSFFSRSGYYGSSDAGVFYFGNSNGGTNSLGTNSFRVCLAV